MKKRIVALFLLVLTMLTLCGCESDLERAQRELDEATKRANESRQKANEAKEKVRILEDFLDLAEKYGR